jgi:hypothetical protein
VHKVLLGKLHQEVCIKLDVKFKIPTCLLGGSDVKVKGLIQELYCLFSVALLPPLNQCLDEDQLRHLLALTPCVGIIDFINELELLVGVIKLVLPDPTVDHADQGGEVALIERGSFLISCIGTVKISLDLLLVADLSVEGRVFGL